MGLFVLEHSAVTAFDVPLCTLLVYMPVYVTIYLVGPNTVFFSAFLIPRIFIKKVAYAFRELIASSFKMLNLESK